MTKLRDEEKLKKEVAKDEEIISAIGKEGEKGEKYAKEYFKKEDAKELKIKEIEKEFLGKKKKDKDYIHQLAKMLLARLRIVDLPSNWTYQVAPTDKGVVMELFNGQRRFRTAFKASFNKDIDTNAVDVFALRAMNTPNG